MTRISFPTTTTSISGAQVEIENQDQKILVVSQMLSGTAVSGDLNQNILDDADLLAGEASIGAALVRAIRAVNEETRVDAIFVDEAGAGTQATGAVAFTGTATESGELKVSIGSKQNHVYSVAITSGDSATVIGDALAAAIAADSKAMISSVNTTGSVALTAKQKGTVGNGIPVEVSGSAAGVTVAITAMSGGATDPTLTSVLDAVDGQRYQTIIWTWPDSMTVLLTELNARVNSLDTVLDGVGFTGISDTLANILTDLGSIDAPICIIADKQESSATLKGASNVEHPLVQAATAAALRALKLTDGAAIASLNVGQSGFDATGGPALASRPYANTPVFTIPAAQSGRGWTDRLELNQIAAAGGSVIGSNRRGTQTILGEMRLVYSSNPTFGFLNAFDTASNIREFYDNNLRNRYGQSRLTGGAVVEGRPMVNKRMFEAALVEFYDTLSGPDYALTQAGEEARLFFINNMVVSVDLQTGSVTWAVKSPIVVQLRSMTGDIQIAYISSAGSMTL